MLPRSQKSFIQMLLTLSCFVSVVAAGQGPVGQPCCGPVSVADGWLVLCRAQQSHPGAELVFPLHAPVPDLRQLRRPCERPAPTKAASPLTWLPEKAEPGSERETVRVLGGLYFCVIFHQVRF